MSLNKVMLIGNVGKEPEIRYLDKQSNAKVASFSLATTERYKDRSGEMREMTEWHNIVAWRNSADIVEKYVHKGTQLYIEGRLRTRSWDDQNGNKRYTTEINVDNLQLLGRKGEGQDQNFGQNYGQNGGQGFGQNGGQGYGQNNGQGFGQNGGYAKTNSYEQTATTRPAPVDNINDMDMPDDDLPF